MFNILDAITAGLSDLNTPIGLVGSLVTIFDHFKNKNSNHIKETRDAIREKSSVAYARYCEHQQYRQNDLGIPLEDDILGYWEKCLQRNVLPSASDMVASQMASKEEAEVIISYLMEQWMTIPDFSAWLHDILFQNHLEITSERLSDLSQILEAVSQIKARLDSERIDHIATLITPSYVTDARISCNDLTIKNFFTVDNNFHTMLQVISADEDVPHKEAAQAIEELIQSGTPAIIAGNGGQGKTSLMMRAAVQNASSGHLTIWLSLSTKEIITEQLADQFFDCLIKLTPAGESVLLCIDNPFEGRESFSSLQARWPYNSKIHLLMAERENRLTLLADPDQDLLLRWFDHAGLVVLQGINQTREYRLKDYPSRYFSESVERRKSILEKSTSYLVKEGAICKADQLSVISKTLGRYGKPYVSLVELIYRTLFELKKITSKPGSIKLDWEEWGDLIQREFGEVDTDIQLYGVIAALKVFNTPLSISLFCKRFDELNERKLRTRLCERFVPRHVEPIVYQERNETLQPKHDVIAELFFLFNESKVTINSVIFNLLDVMDENEIEVFLTNIKNKKEIQKGQKPPIGEIDYWGYWEHIYSRIQEGSLNLSYIGKTYLCLGFLWARYQKGLSESSFMIKTVLDNLAPEIEDELWIIKLYTEWGIWLAEKKNNSAAEEKFLIVIKINSSNIHCRTELGRLLSRQRGREAEAEKYLLEIIAIDPKNIQSRTELGRLLSRQRGREAEAEKYLLETIRIDPKNLHSRSVLAKLYESMDRLPEAKQLYQELCNIDPGNRFGIEGLSRLK